VYFLWTPVEIHNNLPGEAGVVEIGFEDRLTGSKAETPGQVESVTPGYFGIQPVGLIAFGTSNENGSGGGPLPAEARNTIFGTGS